MASDFDFNEYDLMNPEDIESKQAWRSWVAQSIGLILSRLDDVRERQNGQGKRLDHQNGNVSGMLEEIEKVKSVQEECVFRWINTWGKLTAAGGGVLVAVVSGTYAVIKLFEYFT